MSAAIAFHGKRRKTVLSLVPLIEQTVPNKQESIASVLIVGHAYSLLAGSLADNLKQVYKVRVAETRDTVLTYLDCMKFDLVVIEHAISDYIVAAITNAIPPETDLYFPAKSAKTVIIATEIRRRLEWKRNGLGGIT